MNGRTVPVWICEQPNGERLRVEHWAYVMWAQGRLTDPMLLRALKNAVAIYEDGARWKVSL